MSEILIAIILKPLAIVAIFGMAIMLSRFLLAKIPQGKLRSALMFSINRRP
jgi:hypothetical protein